MRIGSKPDGPLEWLLVKANKIPLPLIDSFSAMMNARAILTANEIGLFNALVERPLPPRVLARHLGASARGIEVLADALCANGYLARDGERFGLTEISRKWLVRSSPTYIGNMLEHVNDLWAVWLNLEEAIRTGVPQAGHYQNWLRDEEHQRMLRRHIVGLRDMARFSAPEILAAVRLPRRARRLLDVGGGHGGYSIAFCREYSKLAATVFDLDAAAAIGRELVAGEGMRERVEFRVGDFLEEELGSDYDAALYFNIVHNYSEDENRRVLMKVSRSLKRGGVIVVWDMFKQQKQRDMQPALMALHMLVASGGTSYLIEEIIGWLRAAGFNRPRITWTRTAPGLALVVAHKA
jgi:ubiquinone/menaquinone biosynthesis C-methylase UbiE